MIAEEQAHARFRERTACPPCAGASRLFSAAGRKASMLQNRTSCEIINRICKTSAAVRPAAETVHASGVRSPIHDPCYP